MIAWSEIGTAPKDGRTLELRRVVDDKVVIEGLGYRGELKRPLPGLNVCNRYWLNPDGMSVFPTPTHWKPAA